MNKRISMILSDAEVTAANEIRDITSVANNATAVGQALLLTRDIITKMAGEAGSRVLLQRPDGSMEELANAALIKQHSL
jgi:hypothetical protein